MEDRFRFRAWENKENKYIYDAEMTYDSLGIGAECFGFMVDGTYKDLYTVEQCTGLKDKNGKLIYEGDIVRTSGNYQEGVYKIGWNEDDAEYDLYEGDYFIYQLVNRFNSVEVIGNIHENAELLNEND